MKTDKVFKENINYFKKNGNLKLTGIILAAVSAALAEELGTDISRIRIHSLRPVGAAAPAADPARGELVAAIAAAAAEELGTDVSRIRIHSLRKIG